MLKKRNVRLLLNTGRAVREMEKLPKEFLDLADMIASSRGARIEADHHVRMWKLDPASTAAGMKSFEDHAIVCRWVGTGGQCCLTRQDAQVSDLFFRLYRMRPQVQAWQG